MLSKTKQTLLYLLLCSQIIHPSQNLHSSLKDFIYRKSKPEVLQQFFQEHPDAPGWHLSKGQTAGHLLLNTENIEGFNAWLDTASPRDIIQKTDEQDKFPGSTVLHALCFKAKQIEPTTFMELLRKLCAKDPTIITKPRNDGLTPLYMLAFQNHDEGSQFLYNLGTKLSGTECIKLMENLIWKHIINNETFESSLQLIQKCDTNIDYSHILWSLLRHKIRYPELPNRKLQIFLERINPSLEVKQSALDKINNPQHKNNAATLLGLDQQQSATTASSMNQQPDNDTCVCCVQRCYCCSLEQYGPHTEYWQQWYASQQPTEDQLPPHQRKLPTYQQAVAILPPLYDSHRGV